jgi:GT2 family glycosyltransferase
MKEEVLNVESNVVIGVPISPEFQADVRTVAMIESWTRENGVVSVYEASPSPEEGRDKIIAKLSYMRPRPQHILFMDSDVLPRPRTLDRLLYHDKDIIAGAVPICQQGKFKWNVYRNAEAMPVDPDAKNLGLPDNPFKVDAVGFGVVLIKTDVFDSIEWPFWRSIYKPGLRSLGEDLYFCAKAKGAGFDIWVDPKVKCSHATRSNYLSIIRNLKQGVTK